MTPIILGRGFIMQTSPFDTLKRLAVERQPEPITYEFTRNLDCLPGELSPNGWHKEV